MNHQIPNLLLLLSVFSYFSCFLVLVPVNAEVFLSIDCGSSSLKPHTDYNSIVWVADDPYTQTGETHKVMIDAPDVEAWDSRVMSTLRAFPTRKKNCYSIDIDDKAKDSTSTTKVERFLVRASFYYGNYDNKFRPPTFNLQFNGNSWSQIVTDQDNILVNNKLDGVDIRPSGPVTPLFGYAIEVLIFNVTSFATSSSYSIDFVRTKDSNLPPLINAIEGYTVGDKLVQGTNSSDVNSLSLLQKSFLELGDWNGDPCLPSPYTWDWVACRSDADSPRVTALYLNDLRLVGTLPDFSDMDALDAIDLHNNSLTGEIPDFFGILPKLRVLNLADNNFSGTIPLLLSNNVNLNLNASGNPNLSCKNTSVCNTDAKSRIPSPSNKKSYVTLTRLVLILLIPLYGLLL